jgi:transposase
MVRGRIAVEEDMRRPIFVRRLSEAERETLHAALRSRDAFVLRRAQIVLASARGERAPQIAKSVGCADQTVREVIRAFDATGLAALARRSSRPRTTHPAFGAEGLARLPEVLHQSPRAFGHATSLWTLPLVAEVSFAEGLTRARASGETIRATLRRLGVRWQRAKRWVESPDPQYARKKGSATA